MRGSLCVENNVIVSVVMVCLVDWLAKVMLMCTFVSFFSVCTAPFTVLNIRIVLWKEWMKKERQKKNENMIIITVYFAFWWLLLDAVCVVYVGGC